MSEVNAWLLDFGGGLHAAVGDLEMIHALPDAPSLFAIPRSPDYCRQVLVWQGEVLPLMDVALRLAARPPSVNGSGSLIVITAFQDHPGAAPRHGALLLNTAPVRIRVNDTQACELPESQSVWGHLAIACFEHQDRGPVPVLDLRKLFSLP